MTVGFGKSLRYSHQAVAIQGSELVSGVERLLQEARGHLDRIALEP
jgi:hypothetical protein